MVYSTATDEITGTAGIVQHAVFIQGVNVDFQLLVEFSDLVPVKGTTDADEIPYELENLFSKYKLSRENTIEFVGAPSMIGKSNSAARKKKGYESMTSFFTPTVPSSRFQDHTCK